MPSVYRPRSAHGYNAGMGRFFQFRLRTLFVVTTLAAVLAWAILQGVAQYREHQRRVNEAKMEAALKDLYKLLGAGPSPRPDLVTPPDRP